MANVTVKNDDAAQRRPAVLGTVVGLCVFACVAASVGLLFHLSYQARIELLRHEIESLARAAALMVDGDLHGTLRSPEQTGGETYRRVIAPLVAFHNRMPDIHYLYTMVEVDGRPHFVLDTGDDPDLKTERQLDPATVMERYDDPQNETARLIDRLRAGESYADDEPFTDPAGTFISGLAPFFESSGRFAGVVGLDFNVGFYDRPTSQIRRAAIASLALGAALSAAVGWGTWRGRRRTVAMEESLRRMATTDPLTGAANRRRFLDAADAEAHRFRRYGRPYSLLMLDIDHFKGVNDTYGHAAGDQVLIETARRCGGALRMGDLFGRLGGEEFAALLPETGAEEARILAERLRRSVAEVEVPAPNGAIRVTVSIGVAEASEGGGTAEAVLALADGALYRAKEAGRDRVIIASADHPDEARRPQSA